MSGLVGAPGRSAIVRAFGARELAAGAGIFHSPNTAAPVWGRVAGDALDLAALAALAGPGNPRRKLALAALAFVAGATLIDILAARQTADRTSVVWGKRWSVRVNLGGRRFTKKKT